jgi:hypothetical protein
MSELITDGEVAAQAGNALLHLYGRLWSAQHSIERASTAKRDASYDDALQQQIEIIEADGKPYLDKQISDAEYIAVGRAALDTYSSREAADFDLIRAGKIKTATQKDLKGLTSSLVGNVINVQLLSEFTKMGGFREGGLRGQIRTPLDNVSDLRGTLVRPFSTYEDTDDDDNHLLTLRPLGLKRVGGMYRINPVDPETGRSAVRISVEC